MTVGAKNDEVVFSTIQKIPIDVIYLDRHFAGDGINFIPSTSGTFVPIFCFQIVSEVFRKGLFGAYLTGFCSVFPSLYV